MHSTTKNKFKDNKNKNKQTKNETKPKQKKLYLQTMPYEKGRLFHILLIINLFLICLFHTLV